MRVFVSYQTRDLVPAEALTTGLKRNQPALDFFLAPRVLTAGAYWLPKLADELAKADAVIFLAGQRIGPWQELEYYEAQRLSRQAGRNNRPLIVPVIMTEQAPGLPFFELLHQIFAPDPSQADALAAVQAGLAGTPAADQPPAWKRFNPYKGLSALGSADAAFFFGREALTAHILDELKANPASALVLVGASGVGKSSVAQAGVLAALKSQIWPGDGGQDWPDAFADSRAWLEVTIRPGDAALKELALAFVRLMFERSYEQDAEAEGWANRFRHGAKLKDLLRMVRHELKDRTGSDALRRFVLHIDQGEELYARTPPADAACFSALIAEAVRLPDFHVIASIRADYYGQLQSDAALFPVTRRIDVPPLPAEQLEAVIRRPAERLGARFESRDMPAQIAEATARESGALPLLSYLMSDMWLAMQARADGVLRWSDHPDLIDLAAPLRKRADQFRLGRPDSEPAMRRLFTLRLSHVPWRGEPVRRRARRSECEPDEWEIAETLAGFDLRLLTLNLPEGEQEPTAEVAHEQLLRKWPTLTQWLEEWREFLIWKGELEVDRAEWEKAAPADKSAALLAGRRLFNARRWLGSHGQHLAKADRAFVEASVAAEEERRQQALANEQRLQEERDSTARVQDELAKLKDLYMQIGRADALRPSDGAVEEARPPLGKRPARATAGKPTWGITAVSGDKTRYTGQGAVVAILGTGIDADHPAFRGMTLIQKDFTGSGNGDQNGHSTHTSGTIFGRGMDRQRIGVAPGVSEALIAKVLDDRGGGQTDHITAALQWVIERRADVICLALGIDYPSSMSHRISEGARPQVAIASGLREYLQLLRVYERLSLMATSLGKGSVVITAGGNESQPDARAPITSPLAVAHGVISVGSVEQRPEGFKVSSFSNSHPTLCAPGGAIVSAVPGGGLKEMTGTSMACAHAAGVAALWWDCLRSQNPGKEVTSDMVRAAIVKAARADGFAPDERDVDRGAGIIQAPS